MVPITYADITTLKHRFNQCFHLTLLDKSYIIPTSWDKHKVTLCDYLEQKGRRDVVRPALTMDHSRIRFNLLKERADWDEDDQKRVLFADEFKSCHHNSKCHELYARCDIKQLRPFVGGS
jgi:hypothetical protein